MLRDLEKKDAPLMLEWMHDENVISGLQPELFRTKTIEDCEKFILACQDKSKDCHMAIVDENDEYLGTVSLKKIDFEYKDAEFAIVLRLSAQGKGYASKAIKEIMKIAFEDYGLTEVYWNVLRNNYAAIKLYRSCGYNELEKVSKRRINRAPRKENGDIEDILFFHATMG